MIPITKFLLNDLLPTFVCKLVNLISLSLLCSLKWTVKSIFFHVCRHDNHFYQIAFFSDQSETFVSRQLFTERVHYFFTLWSNETDNSNRSELWCTHFRFPQMHFSKVFVWYINLAFQNIRYLTQFLWFLFNALICT